MSDQAHYLEGQTVLVLGLGDSGLALARWCDRCGANVRVWDSRDAPPQAAALRESVPKAELLTGTLTDAAFAGAKLVLKSPGLSPRDERIAAPLARAADSGVLVQGELDLFARALADLKTERGYAPKVVAITGTNGKTTTTSMAALLIERAGKRVGLAGNIGPTMLGTLMDALALEPEPTVDAPVHVEAAAIYMPISEDSVSEAFGAIVETADDDVPTDADDTPIEALVDGDDDAPVIAIPVVAAPPAAPVFEHLPDVWVLELSSFQLDEAKGFEPDAATVLNLSEDHLDWHGDMAAYIAAKARVFGTRATMVINRDDAQVEKLVPAPIAVKGRNAKPIERHVIRFGLDAPRRPGDYGIVNEGGIAWLVRALEADLTIKRAKRGAVQEEEEIHLQRLMPADALRVRGRHNAANALAALALATAVGCQLAPMLHGLREYGGEPHRVELITTVNGVDAFDDSKGTNVGATVAALDGLGLDKAPAKLVVILGGDGKGQDFSPLARPVSQHVRAVSTLGRDAEAIEHAIATSGVPMQRHASLEDATRWAFTQAHAGDAVLLSPACASLDMFRNYEHRAAVFVGVVNELAADQGVVAL